MQSTKASSSRALDKFYTKPHIAQNCIKHVQKLIQVDIINVPKIWIEPSAGAGAFLQCLPNPKIGIDIEPEQEDIIQHDFLKWQPELGQKNITVIGNPPFGKRAKLAVDFFNHAASFANQIAFIVPRTFEKESIHRRLNLHFHQVSTLALGKTPFTLDGKDYPVPTVFQVWKKETCKRVPPSILRHHPDMEFVSRDNADFAFQRVGVRAGTIKKEFSQSANASHFFIRADRIDAKSLRDRLNALDFSEIKYKTAGNPSISKSELIKLYIEKWGDN